jgi:DNA invertase Pin-like site-specific DNA recombinase
MNNRQKIAERREIAERGLTPIPMKYCLYSRKSSEQDELQALSIESQIKEMLLIAEKENLNVVEIYRESHSAKESGQRPVFNQMLADIRSGKFNGILTWHPDRISRNAGDLGIIVDFLDAKKLIEIRTYSQKFTNNPSEKFLFMILGSQAKLENDNKSVNVKRGLKTKCEMGLWPGVAPTAYLNSKNVDEKGVIFLDPVRAPLIKQVFEKIAYDGWSGRKAYLWMTNDIKFTTKKGKKLSLGNLYLLLKNSFYTGTFEYPRGSGKFFKGKHKPIITQEVFDLVQKKLEQNYDYERNKEFAFTRLMICGICGSGITADEKWKTQKNGNNHRYVYYVCCKSQDRQCKNPPMREEDLILQLEGLIDTVSIDELGLKERIRTEVERHKKFQAQVTGEKGNIKVSDVDVREYAKYLLREGEMVEKRALLLCLKSKIVMGDRKISLA